MMRRTPTLTRWLIILRQMCSPVTYQAILDCAEAIAQSRGADVLDLAHIERALDWLVLDK